MLADLIHKLAAMKFESSGKYYPRASLAGPERCIRQMVYWARGKEKKPVQGRMVVVLEDSSWHEELSLDQLRTSAYKVHSEQMPVDVPSVFPWRGNTTNLCKICDHYYKSQDCHSHIDWICTDLLGEDFLVEHKAINHFGFERLAKGQELPLDYLTQTAIYFRGIQRIQPELKRGLLLVKNKNQGAYIEYHLRYENADKDTLSVDKIVHSTGDELELKITLESITKQAFAKFSIVNNCIEKGVIPTRPYSFDHWRCEYCAYNTLCWGGYAKEHEALQTSMTLPDEVADTVRYERELQAQEGGAKKARVPVKETLKKLLTALGVRHGHAGEYIINWTVNDSTKLDTDLLTPAERARITIPSIIERLNIRKKPNDKPKKKVGL